MTLPDLSTTTNLTKYLRAKTTPVNEILTISNALLQDELPVYLPNKGKFLLELIIDRLNDAKIPNSHFKSNCDVWELYLSICSKLAAQKKKNEEGVIRSTFQGFRFLECIHASLKDSQADLNLVIVISRVLKFVRGHGLLNLGNSQADLPLLVLSDYLQIINNSSSSSPVEDEVLEITKFYKALTSSQTATTNADAKSSKKHQDQFINTALPTILQTLTSVTPQFKPLESLVRPYLTLAADLTAITTQLLKIKSLPASSLITYYKLITAFHAKSSASVTEPSFLAIVNTVPETIHELLQHTLTTSRSLSLEFLTEIYQAEFNKMDENQEINWGLILTIIKLNIEIGISNTDPILKALNNLDDPIAFELSEVLINAYIKIRSFPDLYSIILQLQLPFTVQSSFLSLLTRHVKELTPLEINKCIEANLNASKFKFDYLNSLIQGFFEITDQVTLTRSRELFRDILKLEDKLQDNDQGLVFAKFQILCLYEDLLTEEELLEIATSAELLKSGKGLKYYYFLVFRIRELLDFDLSKKVIPSFVKFITKSKDGNSDVMKSIWKRWFVLINELFSTEQISELTKALLSTKDTTLIQGIFANELIFECSKVMDSLVEQLVSVKTLSDFETELLVELPIECYARRLKAPLIDKLSSATTNTNMAKLIKHVLQTPTFKSGIESDVKKLLNFMESCGDELGLELFKLIVQHHVVNFKEEANSQFITDLINKLNELVQKLSDVTVLHKLSSCLIEELSRKEVINTIELNSTVLASIKKMVSRKGATTASDLAWILDTLTIIPLKSEDHALLKPGLVKIASSAATDNNEVKGKLFTYLARNVQHEDIESVDLSYYLALYIALRSSGCENLKSGLNGLLKNVGKDTYYEGLSSVLLTLQSEEEHGSMGTITELIEAYIMTLSKDEKDISTKFFTKILNSVISQVVKFSSTDLELLMKTLQTVLTTQSYLITQFSLELILSLISTVITNTSNPSEALFDSTCIVISLILTLQRYRLSSRNHVLMSLFISLLTKLAQSPTIRESKSSAMSLQRLMTNLCDPSTSVSSSTQSQTELHAAQSKVKAQLRHTLPPLLLSYIHTQLQSPFPPQTTTLLLPGIYAVLDVLSQDELILVNASIDSGARAYLRVVIDGYKDGGKWRG